MTFDLPQIPKWGKVNLALYKPYDTFDIYRYGSPKCYNDSRLWYAICNELRNAFNFDVIKKLMWKDGNLVDQNQYYVRSRNMKELYSFMIWDPYYQIRPMYKDYNRDECTVCIYYPNVRKV